jgi:uncharacterized protein YeaO (DUF488 family)
VKAMIRLRRAYEEPNKRDGYRVLVERLWPRGVRKDALHLDDWFKDVAPSHALRRWFGHDPAKWKEFTRRYRAELRQDEAAAALRVLAQRASRRAVTLIYSAKNEQHNSAVVLRDAIEELLAGGRLTTR